MTRESVAELLTAMSAPDHSGWNSKNITAGLLLATWDVSFWEGLEWSMESGMDDKALAWAAPWDARTPFDWLCAKGVMNHWRVQTYQDDAFFGLAFSAEMSSVLPREASGSLRPRHDLSLTTGQIRAVEIVYDATIDPNSSSTNGVVTEFLLHGDDSSTHLIAAEAYSRDEWHHYDESVVVLTDPQAADRLQWHPARQPWRSSQLSPLSRRWWQIFTG